MLRRRATTPHNRLHLAFAAAVDPAGETTAWDIPPQGSGWGEPPRRPRRPVARPGSRLLVVGGAMLAVFLVVALGGALAFRSSVGGKMYDNVYVDVNGQNPVNIGGMTKNAARTTLAEAFKPALAGTVTLSYNQKQWTPTYAELGIGLDLDRTVAEAYQTGRSGGPIGQMWRAWQMRSGAKAFVPLYVRVDNAPLDAYLDTLMAQIGTPPKDAAIAVQGNQIVTAPGADGVTLDRGAVRQQLLDGIAHLRATSLSLPVTFAAPARTTEQVEQAKARAEALVAAPLSLTFEAKKFDLTRDDLLAAVRFGPNLDITLDTSTFAPKVNAIAKQLQQDPQDADIGWDNGLVVRQPAKNGQRLNVDETMKRLAAWKGDTREISLPVEVTKPRITDDVSALGITTRIGRGISNFSGSDAARANNIAVAAKYLDNTIVAPGETFSFLNAIGDITKERGYKEGYVILAEETVPGIGGGVCQVATTMFRAAMWSGLPIVERNPHAYIVSYYQQGGYPLGFDAAVFSPGVDLKFQNTTDKYLLVKTGIDGGNLYVSIYGPDLGYKVDISDPVIGNKKDAPEDEYQIDPTLPPGTKKQVEFAKTGEDVALTRTVRDASGAIVRQATFSTRYQAWPNKFLVSPDRAPGNAAKATTAPNTPSAPATPAQPSAPAATLPATTAPKPQATPTTAKPAATVAPTKKP
jgi:vancomycin resistance protein YoaR